MRRELASASELHDGLWLLESVGTATFQKPQDSVNTLDRVWTTLRSHCTLPHLPWWMDQEMSAEVIASSTVHMRSLVTHLSEMVEHVCVACSATNSSLLDALAQVV